MAYQVMFNLPTIGDNPYQPRLSEDLEHILAVARSIAQDGLLQVPVGRESHTPGLVVELAFGHTRLRAFRLLAAGQVEGVADPERFEEMPVVIRDLDDEEMFRFAVTENLARKQLTPIEEARAMQRYLEEFGKTSEEVGELFNLSGPAVRGKIRLLRLPEDFLQALSAGNVSESVAREMLTFYDLPEEIQEKGKGNFWDWRWHGFEEFLKDVLSGNVPASSVQKRLDEVYARFGHDLDKKEWKDADIFEHEMIEGVCTGCEYKLVRGKTKLCMQPRCFEAKRMLVRNNLLRRASEAIGLPADYDYRGDYGEATRFDEFNYRDGHPELDYVNGVGCENRRVVYHEGSKKLNGWPNIEIVCQKRSGFCTCMRAMKNKIEMPAVENKQVEAPRTSEADLKIVRKQLRDKSQAEARKKAILVEMATRQVRAALEDFEPAMWVYLVRQKLNGTSLSLKDFENPIFADKRDLIFQAVATAVVARWAWYDEKFATFITHLNNELLEAGLQKVSESEAVEIGDPDGQ